jgi:hypothetical protein
MAYQAGGTDYAGFARQRAQADEGLTRALDAKGRADKQARIKKSGQRSGLQKLVSAGVRGAAAYYSGGLSEQMGAGGMIDEAMLGTDSEGRAVRNEYGDLVGAGSQLYSASKAMKAGKLGEQDARFDKLMDRRQKNVKMLFDADQPAEAMKAQAAMEDMRLKYDTNRKDAEGKGWGGSGLGMSDEDYNIQPESMTSGQRAAQVARLNKSEADVAREQAIIGDEGRRQQGQTMMPVRADAPSAPDLSQVGSIGPAPYETQRGPDLSKIGKVGPAPYKTSQSAPSLQAQATSEKEDLIQSIAGQNPYQGVVGSRPTVWSPADKWKKQREAEQAKMMEGVR